MSSRDLVVAAAGSAGAPADDYFKNVSLLLSGDGTNGAQNNTFLDSSSNNFTITRNGNTTQGTFSPYGNLWSNYQPNSAGQGLTVPTNTALNLGTGDFTIEAWVNTAQLPTSNSFTTSAGGYQCIFGTGPNNLATGSQLYIGTTNILFDISSDGGGPINVAHGFSSNVWYHIALTRNGNTFRLFKDGVLLQSATSTASWNDGYGFQIGGAEPVANGGFTGAWWYGYISNFRIVKGAAIYTSNFTPSTTPLTAVSGTSLLTCQSNRFKDNSSNNFTLTVNGNTSVQRFSPFNPTAPYSAATIGGSGYFDGNDYLNTPTTGQFAPAGDFTVGCWVYPTALGTYNSLLGNYTGNASTDWLFEIGANGTLNFYTNGAAIRIQSAAGAIKIGQWNYVSMSRSGTTITGYVNGTSAGTYTQSGTFGSTSKTVLVGYSALYYTTGYISDVKLIDGSAVTTVPTAPMTATTGTKLLLNFTNAGIPDAAMMNDLETVGNAQVSTSVKKYGTGSMYFDGTGDGLYGPSNQAYTFGTGDFTVECWVYLPVADEGFLASSSTSATTGWLLAIMNGNKFGFGKTGIGNQIQSATTFPTAQWVHAAVSRQSGTIRVFENGVQTATGSDTTNFGTYGIQIASNRPTDTGWDLNCYIDDLRITKGYARYTSNFTPPAQALPTN